MEETPKCKCKFYGYALSKAMVVYPALLLFTTGMFASSISFRYALQDTICYRLHKELKPVPVHGGNSTSANIDCEKDKDVIASTAQWNGVLVTALGLTSCITSGTVAALTDRYGRRLILGLAAFGQTINAVVVLLCLVYNLSPYYFVIGYALNGLTGGYPAFLACAFAYIADLSAKQDRPVLFGGGESMLFLGGVIGPVAIGYIVKSYHHYVAVCVLACISAVLVLYIYLIPKSRQITKSTQSNGNNPHTGNQNLSILQIFYRYNIFTVVIALFKRQTAVLVVVISFMFYFISLLGASVLTGQYTELVYKWGPAEFGVYSAVSTGMLAVGIWFFTSLFLEGPECSRIHELDIMRLSALSRGVMYLIQVLAKNSYSFFAMSGINVLGGLLMPLTRSTVSKSFSAEEQGVALTAVAAVEAVSTLWLPVVFGYIFNYSTTTLDSPQVFLYVCGASSVIGFVLLCFGVSRQGFDSIAETGSKKQNGGDGLNDELLANVSVADEGNSITQTAMNNFAGNGGQHTQQQLLSPDASSRNNSSSSASKYIY